MQTMRLHSCLALSVLVLAGCAEPPPSKSPLTPPPPETADHVLPDPWKLDKPSEFHSPAYLTNGQWGLRIGPSGLIPADPKSYAGMYSSTIYSADMAEEIQPLPSPLPSKILIGGQPLPNGAPYFGGVDMKTATYTVTCTLPPTTTGVTFADAFAPHDPTFIQQWTFTNLSNSVEFDFLPDSPLCKTTRYVTVNGKPFSATNPEKLVIPVSGKAVIQISTGLNHAPIRTPLAAIQKQWVAMSESDIIIDGPVEDQQAIRSFLFYLRQQPENISPMGLSSNHYKGHTFWDADTWIAPSLYFLFPQVATGLADYRLTRFQRNPGLFPWESSVSGKETTTASTSNELHISGDVVRFLDQTHALGLWPKGSFPSLDTVTKTVAREFKKRFTSNPDGTYSLPHVVSVDESHEGNNDLYTNLVAQWVIDGGSWTIPQGAPRLKLPADRESFLTYDGDPVRQYKQAAAILAIFPLNYPPAVAEAHTMLERFASRTSPNGPAMSMSVTATIEARLGQPGIAYRTWQKSFQAFTPEGPLLFSEKYGKDLTYFQTGAAGCLQTVIYGFLGATITHHPATTAAWKTALEDGDWLTLEPHLPPTWKSIEINRFQILGKSYTVIVKRSGGKLLTLVKPTGEK